jgi:hypothetical protein
MNNLSAKSTNQKSARIAGVLYLLIFIVYPLSAFIGKAGIVVPGNAAATFANIAGSENLFRLGIAGEVVIFLVEIIMAGILYELLRSTDPALSFAMALSRVAEAVIQAVNLLPSILALILVSGVGYLTVFEVDQLQALVQLFLGGFDYLILVWGFPFGLHLLLLGYLVYESDLFPRVLGVLLVLGGVGYLLQSFAAFLAPQLDQIMETVVLILAIPGELAFTLYLLIKGVKSQKSNSISSEMTV